MKTFKEVLKCFFPTPYNKFTKEINATKFQLEELDKKISTTKQQIEVLNGKIEESFLKLELACENNEKSLHEYLELGKDKLNYVLDGIEDLAEKQSTLSNEYINQVKRLIDSTNSRISDAYKEWYNWSYGYSFQYSRLPEERANELCRWYKIKTGQDLDLNNPKSLNEKIQWLKLFDAKREKKKAFLADKIMSQEKISNIVGDEHMVPLLGVWDDPSDIDFESLPEKFVIKCNHGSGMNQIVSDKSCINEEKLKKQLNRWLKTDYAFRCGFEMHYSYIKPKILAEKLLEQNTPLMEYQVWCFNGKAEFISVIEAPHGANKKCTYSTSWEKLDYVTSLPILERDIDPPEKLNEILECAEIIASEFILVRVDYYIMDSGRWYFSEVTFTPGSGLMGWYPEKMDMILGKKIDLNG